MLFCCVGQTYLRQRKSSPAACGGGLTHISVIVLRFCNLLAFFILFGGDSDRKDKHGNPEGEAYASGGCIQLIGEISDHSASQGTADSLCELFHGILLVLGCASGLIFQCLSGIMTMIYLEIPERAAPITVPKAEFSGIMKFMSNILFSVPNT